MSAITELATRLGKAIADSPEAAKLRDARKALRAETELSKILKDFQDQSEKVAKLEADNKAVEVEDKHALQELHGKLVASDTFKKFTVAQMDYVDMMRTVQEELQKHMSQGEDEA